MRRSATSRRTMRAASTSSRSASSSAGQCGSGTNASAPGSSSTWKPLLLRRRTRTRTTSPGPACSAIVAISSAWNGCRSSQGVPSGASSRTRARTRWPMRSTSWQEWTKPRARSPARTRAQPSAQRERRRAGVERDDLALDVVADREAVVRARVLDPERRQQGTLGLALASLEGVDARMQRGAVREREARVVDAGGAAPDGELVAQHVAQRVGGLARLDQHDLRAPAQPAAPARPARPACARDGS